MAFIYFPGTQNALDTETASAIGEFLASPRNTENARVVVQFPRLAEGDRLNIVNAILHELTERGVARQDIVFFTIDADADENSFEVNLSFQVPQTGGK
jgi:type IV pilus biogenesis protein CpaD/CtpE